LRARLRQHGGEASTRSLLAMPVWLMVIPLALALHESTVYLGFKHMPTLTMAANLRLHRGSSNHILVRDVPHFEANRIVRLRASSDRRLRAAGGEAMTWLGLRHYLAAHRNASVRFELDGREENVRRAGADPRFRRSAWWSLEGILTRGAAHVRYGLPFVFVTENRPKRCHHRVTTYLREEALHRSRLEQACTTKRRVICAWFSVARWLELAPTEGVGVTGGAGARHALEGRGIVRSPRCASTPS
jgi:hypothetical protein